MLTWVIAIGIVLLWTAIAVPLAILLAHLMEMPDRVTAHAPQPFQVARPTSLSLSMRARRMSRSTPVQQDRIQAA